MKIFRQNALKEHHKLEQKFKQMRMAKKQEDAGSVYGKTKYEPSPRLVEQRGESWIFSATKLF